MQKKPKVSAVLLAGGIGARMKSGVPKQYLTLGNKPVACHSFDLFIQSDLIDEIIVVAEEQYHSFFSAHSGKLIRFAHPGERRQDSSHNGCRAASNDTDFLCIHDAARPNITAEILNKVWEAALIFGGASAAVPLKFTIKKVDTQQTVCETPDRSSLWEVQTPQIMRRDLLLKGFEYAYKHNLTVTDDLSLLELAGYPAKLVEGCYSNIKITTQEDLLWLKRILKPTS